MMRVNVWEARSAGTFNFRANETQGPNPNTASSTAGYGFASLLLGFGQPNDVLIQNWKNVASNSFYLGVLRAGRLARELPADAEPRAALRHRHAAHGALRPDELSSIRMRRRRWRSRCPQFPNLQGGVVFVGVDGNSR